MLLKMNRILTFIILLLSTACSTNPSQPSQVKIVDKREVTPEMNTGFDISLQIEAPNSDKKYYSLITDIEIDSGSYIISPFSKDDFYLPYTLTIPSNVHLMPFGEVLEIPLSVESYDKFIEKQVRLVNENTTYKQRLKIHDQNDFELKGLIEFLIEPQCIPYDVEFVLTQSAGQLKVTKTKTVISEEYKL